jgi:hypothetical protein
LFAYLRRPVNDAGDDDDDDDDDDEDDDATTLIYRRVREAALGLATGVTIGLLVNEIVVDTENPARQAVFTAIGFAALQVPWIETKGNVWRGLGMTTGAFVGIFRLFGIGLPGTVPGAALLASLMLQSGRSLFGILQQTLIIPKTAVEFISRIEPPRIAVLKGEIPRLPKVDFAHPYRAAAALPTSVATPTPKEVRATPTPKEVRATPTSKKIQAARDQAATPPVPRRESEDIDDMRDACRIEPLGRVPPDPKEHAAAVLRQPQGEGIIDVRDFTWRERRTE